MWIIFLLILIVNSLLVTFLFPNADAPVAVPYSLFKEPVSNANVEAIYARGATITGRCLTPVTYPPPGEQKPAASAATETAKRGPPLHFFFQAEDGIRDLYVTGVQTCALPI